MKLFRVIVPVTDIDRAAAYYEALLDRQGRRVSSGRHYLDCEGTILALYSPREDGDSFDPRPNQEHLYFAVDDLSAAHRRARQLEAWTGRRGPRDPPMGGTVFLPARSIRQPAVHGAPADHVHGRIAARRGRRAGAVPEHEGCRRPEV